MNRVEEALDMCRNLRESALAIQIGKVGYDRAAWGKQMRAAAALIERLEAETVRAVTEARLAEVSSQPCTCVEDGSAAPWVCARCVRRATLYSELAYMDHVERSKCSAS